MIRRKNAEVGSAWLEDTYNLTCALNIHVSNEQRKVSKEQNTPYEHQKAFKSCQICSSVFIEILCKMWNELELGVYIRSPTCNCQALAQRRSIVGPTTHPLVCCTLLKRWFSAFSEFKAWRALTLYKFSAPARRRSSLLISWFSLQRRLCNLPRQVAARGSEPCNNK